MNSYIQISQTILWKKVEGKMRDSHSIKERANHLSHVNTAHMFGELTLATLFIT